MDGKKNFREWLNTVFLAVCAVSLVVITLLVWNLPQALNTTSADTENTSATVSLEMKSIETAYGNVDFPMKWAEYLEYEEVQENNSTKYVFYCKLGEDKTELYEIVFGDEKAENPAGFIETEDGRVPVTVNSNEIPVENVNEEDLEILQGMSGTYNDVLLSISEWEGFVYE